MSLLQMAPLALHLLVMVVLSIYSCHAYVMVALYWRQRRRLGHVPPLPTPAVWPTVTVQLPIYNEKYVVARLVDAVCRLDYPRDRLEVQVLDDSTDETAQLARDLVDRWRARGVDIHYLHRTDRTGYKAGALKAGLDTATGEFLALFDADFVPAPDFLRAIMPRFDAPDIGAVQARWGHLNDGTSALTRALAIGLDAHFVVEHAARNASGLFINFNGTAGVWRKETIVSAGNWQADTLTEDLDLSYRAQLRGWRFRYADDVVCPAEIPAEVDGLKSQQYRWTKGAIQTARKILPRLWRQPDLGLLVKLEGTVHLTHNIVFPVMLTLSLLSLPLLFLRETVDASRAYFMWASVFLVWAVSYPLFYAVAQRRIHPDWRRRLLHLPGLMACAVGMSLINTRAVVSGLLNRVSPFVRTPKYDLTNRRGSWTDKQYRARIDNTAVMELVLALYLAVSLAYGATHGQLAVLPFLALPVWGFAWIGWLSLRNSLQPRVGGDG
ncbi:MAG: glycosyltransferase [bacterium]|nr:glycosyltransferase [bacterium]